MSKRPPASKSFSEEVCIIPEIWCGNSATPPKTKGKIYYKTGTRYECMKRGFGAGTYTERGLNLPVTSLQKIKYVGPTYEQNFKKAGIKTLAQLVTQAGPKTSAQIKVMLEKILSRENGVLDSRAYNSTVMYLHRHGVSNLPSCHKIAHKK